jgi:hypothetical protein
LKNKIKKVIDSKIAIVIVSGSAGELDWNLEILDLLLNEGFNLKIIILQRKAYKSIKQNKMVNDFIGQKNDKIEVIFRGGYFIEKIRQYIYLSYRILLKLKIDKYPLMRNIFNLFIKIFQGVFSYSLPSNVLSNKNKKYLFLSEFPSLRKPWDVWMRKFFNKSVFLYHPHSQSIYAKNFDQKFSRYENIDFNKNHFLLLGHQLDYLRLNDGRELASTDLEKVFVGHPSWSRKRISKYKVNRKDFYINSSTKKINILILSKHFGSYFGKKDHNNMANTIIKVIQKIIPNYNVLIKKHPREDESCWDQFTKENSSIKITKDHVQQIAPKMDFVISIFNSASMDCYIMGAPVIEYYNPNEFPKATIIQEDDNTTIWRFLGIAIPANNEEELEKVVTDLMKKKYKLPTKKIHPFYKELKDLSNTWEKKIRNILKEHNFINN